LIEKYRGHVGADLLENIEEVDFIWRDGALIDVVPSEYHGTFDAFIASHVIEHQPDIVDFLGCAARLLIPTGIVLLTIPDKRYCFDYFRPLALTGDVLDSHRIRRTRHNKRTIFNNSAYVVLADGLIAWGQYPIKNLSFCSSLEAAHSEFLTRGEDDASPYTDMHAWQFTPASFQLLILELARLGFSDWRVEGISPTAGCEFHVWLRRGGQEAANALTESELNAQRLDLLKGTLLEAKEQIKFLMPAQTLTPEELILATETVKTENETLRAECSALQSRLTEVTAVCDAVKRERDALTAELDRTMLARDALTTAPAKLSDAVVAVTADHNPVGRAPLRQQSSWWKIARRRKAD
jgi:hypothetical protein